VFYEPPLAAKPQLREKPHQGLPSKNPTWNQGPNVCNFTVTLGLRATVVENGVRETYSARYYNPNTGRFLSRDPLDGQANDPKSLHKYLYAGGDPVNLTDPRGRAATVEFVLAVATISVASAAAPKLLGKQLAKTFWCAEIAILIAIIPGPGGAAGGTGAGAICGWLFPPPPPPPLPF
jgi:RHS repeat-associated protein